MADQIELAKRIAIEAHKGQTRWNGDDYFTAHVEKVAKYVEENFNDILELEQLNIAVAAAYLHDVVEDNPEYTFHRLLEEGVSVDVVAVVFTLTKQKNERYYSFIMRVYYAGDISKLIKIADITCNMADADTKERMSARYAKYELARKILQQGAL